MKPGRIVVLNGTSSAGKTTIATGFRDTRAEALDYWFLAGIDDVLSKLPLPWLDLGFPGGPGAACHDGLGFVSTGSDRRVHVGRLCRELLRAYQSTVADAAKRGLNVIVDDVVLDSVMWADWQAVLDGLTVQWVAVKCDRDDAKARELARGDRPIGMVDAQFEVVHTYADYDHEINTSLLNPDDATSALLRFLGY